MGHTQPLTRAEREEIYRRKLAGETLQEIAAAYKCSMEVVRKWWRRASTCLPLYRRVGSTAKVEDLIVQTFIEALASLLCGRPQLKHEIRFD